VRWLEKLAMLLAVAGCRASDKEAAARPMIEEARSNASSMVPPFRNPEPQPARPCGGGVVPATQSQAGEHVRIASWNVRWFPDSTQRPTGEAGTDVHGVSCMIAQLGAPVVALQEIRDHALARAKRGQLLESLNQHTGGDWQLELDRCPTTEETDSHLAFLFDATRVAADSFHTAAELNPRGACEKQAHPGFGGYFRFAGGFDVQVLNVHMMWGTDQPSLSLRRHARASIAESISRVAEAVHDGDVVVLGDFNTNGCTSCSETLEPTAEVEEARNALERGRPALLLALNELTCTEYDGGTPLPLDHIAVSAGMLELPRNAPVGVFGICAELGCLPLTGGAPAFHQRLSDHCPIAIELIDRDWD
jgi:endonuclease/exonuclease/phosphatase family metal-dependent hydrolase